MVLCYFHHNHIRIITHANPFIFVYAFFFCDYIPKIEDYLNTKKFPFFGFEETVLLHCKFVILWNSLHFSLSVSKFLEVLLRPIKDCFGNKKESMYNAILKKASRNTIFYDTLHSWAKNGDNSSKNVWLVPPKLIQFPKKHFTIKVHFFLLFWSLLCGTLRWDFYGNHKIHWYFRPKKMVRLRSYILKRPRVFIIGHVWHILAPIWKC